MSLSAVCVFLALLTSTLLFVAVYGKQWPLTYGGDPFDNRSLCGPILIKILHLFTISASVSLVTLVILLANLRWDEGILRLAAFTSCVTSSSWGCVGIYFYMKVYMPVYWGPVIAIVGVSFNLVISFIMIFEGAFSLWQLIYRRKQPSIEVDEKYDH